MRRAKKRTYHPNLSRTFNVLTQKWRVPWSILNAKDKQKRYRQAVQAHKNSFPITGVGSYATFSER
jgi:hypothetical protein